MTAFVASLSLILFCNNELLSFSRLLISIGILNESPIKKLHPFTYQTVNLFSSDKCFIYFISELLLRFVLNFFAACLVSTSIRSISTSSLLAIIRSTSIIISSVFGHLFSRPSLAATYYGLMGCVGLSFKHKGYKINWY